MDLLGLSNRLRRRGPAEAARDVEEELDFHLGARAKELEAAGLSPVEARREALERFGDLEQVRRVCIVERGAPLEAKKGDGAMKDFWRDVRYGFRLLRKSPGFTLIAVLTLALGIGANTAIFSVVNAVLLRPLPFAEPERLMVIFEQNIQRGHAPISGPPISVSPADFLDWRAQNDVFEYLAASSAFSATLTGSGDPERLVGLAVWADLLSLLRVQPILGRGFMPEENQLGRDQVALLSYGFWQRRFGGDASVLGRAISLNGQSYTVVGVLPAGFDFSLRGQPHDLWVPLAFTPDQMPRSEHFLTVMGRLKPGVTVGQAQVAMRTIAARLGDQYPETNRNFSATVVPLREQLTGPAQTPLLTLLGAVGFVLLIACANVANLLLARGAARQREMAVRAALGASRRRLVRQVLTESLLLALMGGAVGALLAYVSTDALVQLGPRGEIFRLAETRADASVLVFTLLVALLTGLLFALLPAMQTRSLGLVGALKEGTAAVGWGRQRRWTVQALTVGEIALAFVLLVGAGLMASSFNRLTAVDPGFDPDKLLTLRVSLPQTAYVEMPSVTQFYQQLLERVGALPGVQSVAATTHPPFLGRWQIIFHILGQPDPPPGEFRTAGNRVVTPGYFRAMSIPLRRGRDFSEQDVASPPGVVVVNDAFVRRYFPDRESLGQQIKWALRADDPQRPWLTIIGVVGDTTDFGLDAGARPSVYMLYSQMPSVGISRTMSLMVRTEGDPEPLLAAVRGQVRALEPNAPVTGGRPMLEVLSESVAEPRFRALLFGLFAGLALVLAGVGVYGVVAYAVAQRTHEFGIRLALGAQRRDVLRLVLGQGALMAGMGIALGLAGALALTRFLRTLLFEVTPTDLATFVSVAGVLATMTLLACWLPARRATRVDPVVTLRYE